MPTPKTIFVIAQTLPDWPLSNATKKQSGREKSAPNGHKFTVVSVNSIHFRIGHCAGEAERQLLSDYAIGAVLGPWRSIKQASHFIEFGSLKCLKKQPRLRWRKGASGRRRGSLLTSSRAPYRAAFVLRALNCTCTASTCSARADEIKCFLSTLLP